MALVTIYMRFTSKSIILVHISFQRFRPDCPTIYEHYDHVIPQTQHFLLHSHPSIPVLSSAFPGTENGIFIPYVAKPCLGVIFNSSLLYSSITMQSIRTTGLAAQILPKPSTFPHFQEYSFSFSHHPLPF